MNVKTDETYADAYYKVKRGFLIVGFTGFTGSGCSTARDVLTKDERPQLPPYDTLQKSGDVSLDRRRYE
jgi:hypothetical protein